MAGQRGGEACLDPRRLAYEFLLPDQPRLVATL